ncbi:MAG: pseudaminic acid synthase [Planctomycetota bacterium]
MRLGTREIGREHPPFVIAELSGNHNQSLERALELVDRAAAAGADAVKLQTYTADTMTLDLRTPDFMVSEPGSLWQGRSLHDLYAEAMTPWDWHAPIQQRCRERGLEFFSTPFDDSAVDFLEQLGVAFYKVASFEATHIPLLRRVGATGKPVVLSSGLATLEELTLAAATLRTAGCRELVILKCTSAYPAQPEHANLRTLPVLSETLAVEVGVSDHTMGLAVPLAAIALGACVIEKHFTLSRAEGGVDSGFSLEPDELALLVREARATWAALGRVHFGPSEGDRSSEKYRRSVYAARDIAAGERLTPENLRIVRPSFGLEPRHYDFVLGRTATQAIPRGTPLRWEHVQR